MRRANINPLSGFVGSPSGGDKPAANEAVEVSLNDLVDLNRYSGNLSLSRLSIRSFLSGNYLSRVKGRGMEFDEVRLYTPGDDVRSLDWRVTARTGKPHTKLYREERERPVFISVDYRATMFFATRGVFKSVLAAKLAALTAWSANRHNDRVGGQIFIDTHTLEFKPRRSKQAILHLLKQLADFSGELRVLENRNPTDQHSESAPDQKSTGLARALDRLYRHARPGSLIFLISDFRDLDSIGESMLSRLSRHCDMVPLMIYDPLERALPVGGRYRVSDGHRRMTLNTIDRKSALSYQQKFERRYARVESLALKYGMRFLACCTTDQPIHILQKLSKPQKSIA